jgi:hypothetical protein
MNSIEIKETKDYSIFHRISANREIREGLVRSLIESINQYGYIKSRPIIVDEMLNIIDGQHRFIACQRLGLPIFYSIEHVKSDNVILALNMNQQIWRLQDYIHKHAIDGIEFYKAVRVFMDKYNMGSTNSLIILSGTRPEAGYVRLGKNFPLFKDRERVVEFLFQAKNYLDFWNNAKFVEAVVIVFKKADDHNIKRLLNKIDIIKQQAKTTDYLILFENLINKGLKNESKLSLTQNIV